MNLKNLPFVVLFSVVFAVSFGCKGEKDNKRQADKPKVELSTTDEKPSTHTTREKSVVSKAVDSPEPNAKDESTEPKTEAALASQPDETDKPAATDEQVEVEESEQVNAFDKHRQPNWVGLKKDNNGDVWLATVEYFYPSYTKIRLVRNGEYVATIRPNHVNGDDTVRSYYGREGDMTIVFNRDMKSRACEVIVRDVNQIASSAVELKFLCD